MGMFLGGQFEECTCEVGLILKLEIFTCDFTDLRHLYREGRSRLQEDYIYLGTLCNVHFLCLNILNKRLFGGSK